MVRSPTSRASPSPLASSSRTIWLLPSASPSSVTYTARLSAAMPLRVGKAIAPERAFAEVQGVAVAVGVLDAPDVAAQALGDDIRLAGERACFPCAISMPARRARVAAIVQLEWPIKIHGWLPVDDGQADSSERKTAPEQCAAASSKRRAFAGSGTAAPGGSSMKNSWPVPATPLLKYAIEGNPLP